MNQPLFRADRWFQYQQAKAIRTQAGAIRDGEGLELIVRVADTYFTILERQDGLNAAMAEQNAVKRQLEQVQQRFDVGLVAITDVLESRAGFDSATVNVIEAEGAQTRSFEPLVRLTGRTFDEIYPLQQAFLFAHRSPLMKRRGLMQRWQATHWCCKLKLASRLRENKSNQSVSAHRHWMPKSHGRIKD